MNPEEMSTSALAAEAQKEALAQAQSETPEAPQPEPQANTAPEPVEGTSVEAAPSSVPTPEPAPATPAPEPAKPAVPDPSGTPDKSGTPDAAALAEKRRRDTEIAFHEKARKVAELEKLNAEKDRRIAELEKPVAPRPLTEEELADLSYRDPVAAAKYLSERERYNESVKAYETRMQTENARYSEVILKRATQEAVNSMVEAAKSLASEGIIENIEGTAGASFEEQPESLRKFYESPEFQAVVAETKMNPRRYYNDEGIIDPKTIIDLYKLKNLPAIMAKEKAKISVQTAESIKNAQTRANPLDNARSSGGQGRKVATELTQAEIDNMSPRELKERYAELKTVQQ
jgi:hypothetical protein